MELCGGKPGNPKQVTIMCPGPCPGVENTSDWSHSHTIRCPGCPDCAPTVRDYGNCPNCDASERRIAELEAALKTFADEGAMFDSPERMDDLLLFAGGKLTLGDLRQAAKTLKATSKGD